MGIRFNGGTDGLVINATPLNYDANYTVCVWFKLKTKAAANAYHAIFDIYNAAGTDYDVYGIHGATASVTNLGFFSGDDPWTETWGSTSLAVDTWYCLWLIRASASDRKVYLNGVLEASNTTNLGAHSAVSGMAFVDSGETDCVIGAVKAWDTNLSVAELQIESNTILPRKSTNLYGFWPMLPGANERTRDYGGGAHNWTEVGTLTDEDAPPTGWGALPYILAPAVVASGVNLTMTTATLAGAGQALKPSRPVPAATATLASAGQGLKPSRPVPLTTNTLVSAAQAITITRTAAAVSVTVSTATLAGAAQAAKVQRPVVCATKTLAGAGQGLKVQRPVPLTTKTLVGAGQAITITRTASAVSVTVSTASVAGSAQGLKVSRRIALSTRTLVSSGQGLKPQRSVKVSTVTLVSSGRAITISRSALIPPVVQLNTASLASAVQVSKIKIITYANVITAPDILRGRQTVAALTNKSGGQVVSGDVVIISSTVAGAFTTTTTEGLAGEIVGVAVETIANNAAGRICTHGYVDKVNLSASASLGDNIGTYATPKQARPHSILSNGDFGKVLGTGTSPAAVIWGHPVVDNPITAAGDLIVGGASGIPGKLEVGNSGQVLTVVSGTPAWETPWTTPAAAQGRLTLTTNNPVINSDQLAATSIFYSPFMGNRIGLYDGGWGCYIFSELSIKLTDTQTGTLANGDANVSVTDASQLVVGMEVTGTGIQTATLIQSITNSTTIVLNKSASGSGAQSLTFKVPASKVLDIFIFNNNGTPKLEFGSLWTDANTRSTALMYYDGLLTKSNDATRRYLGSIGTTTTAGQTEIKSSANSSILLWNMYNQHPRTLLVYSSSSHAYTTTAWRSWNNEAAVKVQFVCGVGILANASFTARVQFLFALASATQGITGLGLNATNSSHSNSTLAVGNNNIQLCYEDTWVPSYSAWMVNGLNFLAVNEYGNAASATYNEVRGRGMFWC
jgi:hypothetical protein